MKTSVKIVPSTLVDDFGLCRGVVIQTNTGDLKRCHLHRLIKARIITDIPLPLADELLDEIKRLRCANNLLRDENDRLCRDNRLLQNTAVDAEVGSVPPPYSL